MTASGKFQEDIDTLISMAQTLQTGLQAQGLLTAPLKAQIEHLTLLLKRLKRQSAVLEEERSDLLALVDIARIINSSLDLDDVLRITMDTIVRITGAERAFLMLKDEHSGEMQIRIARNWEQESIAPSESAVSQTVIQRVIETREPVLTTNAQEDPRFGGHESIVAYNLRSIVCIPMLLKDNLLGVLYADNRIHAGVFTEHERDLLGAFANQAAVAIENARLFASLRRTLSEVTELKNMMDNIFSSIVSGVITADMRDRITLCNRAAERILGRKPEEIIGHSVTDVLPVDDIVQYLEVVHQEDRQVIDVEVAPELPDKGIVNWRFNLSPLKDAEAGTQGVAIVLDDLTERKRLEAQHKLFERMVSPAVIQQINPEKLQLGGKRAAITVLFADIRGFTSYSESQTPEELVSVLNRYLAAGAEAVLTEQGTIDKFLGDAIMAWFNAPVVQPDHVLRAVRAALGLRNAVLSLHNELPPEARLSFGVGIHYGDAVLGLIGTQKRLEYTAIGDSVNTAKRIQENARHNQILISAEAYAFVKHDVMVHELPPLQVKGKQKPVLVYEILGLR